MSDNPVRLFGSSEEFATFGNNALAFVRKVQSDDMNRRFPNAPELPEGIELWGLFSADGKPIAMADDENMLVNDALELDLLTVQRQ